ncbi:DUF4184 family protein [Longispora albida]|uniref:DUF4184 family protein n=1 Tax=Longispora albida TaxID=203523 RepID=UPI00036E44B9|nr:DUF4184 family protein [Longispora albida]
MPLTFPSHAAIVLPLKLWRPKRFDGVALVLGTTAPDLPYAAVGVLPYTPGVHNLAGIVWFCLPVVLLGCFLTRWAAPLVAPNLPGFLKDYGVLGRVRHPWYVTVWSAVLGSFSHLFWDGFTHNPESFQAWATRLLTFMDWEPFTGVPVWWLAQQASTVFGGLIAVALVLHIGRSGLLRDWHGAPPPGRSAPALFWGVLAAATALFALVSFLLPSSWFTAVIGVRLLVSGGLGVLAGAAALAVTGTRKRVVA